MDCGVLIENSVTLVRLPSRWLQWQLGLSLLMLPMLSLEFFHIVVAAKVE